MKRTTIMLPPSLKTRALKRAEEMGISLGELIRESLENALEDTEDKIINDPLFSDNAVFSDQGPTDLAKNHDRYLYGNSK